MKITATVSRRADCMLDSKTEVPVNCYVPDSKTGALVNCYVVQVEEMIEKCHLLLDLLGKDLKEKIMRLDSAASTASFFETFGNDRIRPYDPLFPKEHSSAWTLRISHQYHLRCVMPYFITTVGAFTVIFFSLWLTENMYLCCLLRNSVPHLTQLATSNTRWMVPQ